MVITMAQRMSVLLAECFELLALKPLRMNVVHTVVVTFNRKTKYFHNGQLDWDVYSREGQYVQENCLPLAVSWIHVSLPFIINIFNIVKYFLLSFLW